MDVACPECGSRFLKPEPAPSLKEQIRSLLGTSALTCADCGARFVARTWHPSWLRFARCPKCLRMDLNLWGDHMGFQSDFKKLLIHLGAHAYRCEYCRLNFVSFRKRKEKFRFDRWRRLAETKAQAQARSQAK